MSKVSIQRTKLTLPTYPVGQPNINPIISQYRSEKPYPYPMYDELGDEKIDVEYEALVAENEYLRMTVIPALGGKLYSALDKRNGKELFYRNQVVKPQLVGLTGAWTSGGIEFNFPLGHRPSTMELVDATIRQNRDGSGSIHIGEIDKISGLRFRVELRLEPGKAYIEQIVSIYNPTPIAQRFFYWNTASYPETEHLECRYPARWIIEEHNRHRMPWPFDGEVDVRRSRNIQKFSSIFTSFTDEDFFGVYDVESDTGNVHVAHHREVPGKKFWSWGQSELGLLWNRVLTDEDGPYMEHQAGNIETQYEYRYLLPYQKSSWKEYWMQAIDTGAFTYADRHAVVTTRASESSGDRMTLHLAIRANASYPGTKIMIIHEGVELAAITADLDPERTWRQACELDVQHLTTGRLKLRLIHAEGELMSEHTIHRTASLEEELGEPDEMYPDDDLSTELVRIAKVEERLQFDEAVKLYDALLATHPHYVEAYIRKAAVQLNMWDVDAAAGTVEAALRLTPFSDEAHYFAGLIRFMQGSYARAKQHLLHIIDTSVHSASANVILAKIALCMNDPYRALRYAQVAQKRDGFGDTADVLEAYAWRKLGQEAQARAKLVHILQADPLNGWALTELDALDGAERRAEVIRNDIHGALALVQHYHDLGDWDMCAQVLHAFPEGERHPLILVHLGYVDRLKGDETAARQKYALAETISTQGVYPMARVTLAALHDAVEMLGEEAVHTLYYAGLIYNAKERFTEAIEAWSRCVEKGMDDSVLYRNLGHYYMRQGEEDKAIELLEKGLGKRPHNTDIAIYLNSMYKRKGWIEKRLALLDENTPIERLDQMSARMRIGIYNDAGQFDKALDILTCYRFRNWEIETVSDLNLRQLYQEARLGKARQLMAVQRWSEAIAELKQALVYPANTLLAKRWDQSFAKENYMLAVCHERMGQFAEAIAYCRRVVEERLTPDDALYSEYVKAAHKLAELEWLGL